jgi:hypothetical protein
VENEEIRTTKIREIERAAAPGYRPKTRTPDERSILALQHSAGNRAVGALLAGAPRMPGVGDAAAFGLPVQREPEDPPEEERVWPVVWPEETEGETNEPCFDADAKSAIGLGVAWADSAVADLTSMPPNFQAAVPTMETAFASWEGAFGGDPGQTALNEAKDTISRAGVRVSARTEPVESMLEQLTTAAVAASGDASAAATMMTTPESAEDESRPCFEEGQQAVIAQAVTLADTAATELAKRPPDYRRALATLRSATTKLASIGGEGAGQAKLKGAVATLDRVVDAVDAYLTPVEAVVAEAAADVQAASAQARQAAEMLKPAPYAAGESVEPPDGGGAPVPSQRVEP